jgi:hypothetical protein
MQAKRWLHLTAHEIEVLYLVRNLPPADQDYLLEFGYQLIEARRPHHTDNVILLSDPFRKYPKSIKG